MIDPDNLKSINAISDDIISLSNGLPDYDYEDYDMSSEKDFKRYIQDIEKDVRHSREYQLFISFLKENMDMNHCSFFEAVNNKDTNHIRVEIHHTPFSLYDICIIVYNKRVFYGEGTSVFEVSKEVAICHYNLIIGLIPLSKTIHKLVHNGYLFIPADHVLGRYDYFVEYYKDFIDQDTMETLDKIEQYTDLYKNDIYNKELIEEKHIYINPEGSYELPVFENLQIAMDRQIDSIKNNHYQIPTKYQLESKSYPDNNQPINLTNAITFHNNKEEE